MPGSRRLPRSGCLATIGLAGALGHLPLALADREGAPTSTAAGATEPPPSGILVGDGTEVSSAATSSGSLLGLFRVSQSMPQRWGLPLGFGHTFQSSRVASGPDAVILSAADRSKFAIGGMVMAGQVSVGASVAHSASQKASFRRNRRGSETIEQALAAPIPEQQAFIADPGAHLQVAETLSYEGLFKLGGEVSVGAHGVSLAVGGAKEVRLQVTVRCIGPRDYVVRYEPATDVDLNVALGLGPLRVSVGDGHALGMYYELRRDEDQLKSLLARGDLFGTGVLPDPSKNIVVDPSEGSVYFTPELLKAFEDMPDLLGVGFSRETTTSARLSAQLFAASPTGPRSEAAPGGAAWTQTASYDLARDDGGKLKLRAADGESKSVSAGLIGKPRSTTFLVTHYTSALVSDSGVHHERTALAHKISRDGLSNHDVATYLAMANDIFQRPRGREFAIAGLDGGLGKAQLIASIDIDAAILQTLAAVDATSISRAALAAGLPPEELQALVRQLNAEPNESLQARLLGRWVYGTYFAVTSVELRRMAAIERAAGMDLVRIELLSAAYQAPLDAADGVIKTHRGGGGIDLATVAGKKAMIALLSDTHVARRDLMNLRDSLRGNTVMSPADLEALVDVIRDKLIALEGVAAHGLKITSIGPFLDEVVADMPRRTQALMAPAGPSGGMRAIPPDSMFGFDKPRLAWAALGLIEEHARRLPRGTLSPEDHLNVLLTADRTQALLRNIDLPRPLGELAGFLFSASDPRNPAGQSRIRAVTAAMSAQTFGQGAEATRAMIAYAASNYLDIQTNLDEIIGDLIRNLNSSWSALTSVFGSPAHRESMQALRRLAVAASLRSKVAVIATLSDGTRSSAKQEALRALLEDLGDDRAFGPLIDAVAPRLKDALAGSVEHGNACATIIVKHPAPTPVITQMAATITADGIGAMIRTLIRRDEAAALRRLAPTLLDGLAVKLGGKAGASGPSATESGLTAEVQSHLALLRAAQQPELPPPR